MYISKSSSWLEIAGYKIYEWENAYYLGYNIEKAQFAISNILTQNVDFTKYSNPCTYYHIQVDILIEALGQISSRFIPNDRNLQKYEEIKTNNRTSYDFTSEEYPILYNRKIRNYVTHINERNIDSIIQHKGLSGFNIVAPHINPEYDKKYLSPKCSHNTLNLLDNTYYVYNITEEKYESINLKDLGIELNKLSERNSIILDFILNN